ncbi:MAG: glycosyl transferase [Candidatus Doudnabacteria bacterium RIFCSPHIGHO2_01_FULL_49_9]|uniref:Glycosyl transferase n=1 Tax=Candidatus Doudnabacteria bacterium RIFCSPHIGHO2_01_FULL_49_9 TaxID=1817827 RepID=A0A1F5NYC0_9BACT|nr:MAG: glycosyl transferase [Candidatus Doudnabacteria bacterium RIFCSPHIGHO2_01_FULL_49_9]
MLSGNEKRPSISVFFPCYNDKGTIATLVLEAKMVLENITDDFEIIVVEDGSTDGSRELLVELEKEVPQLRVILHEKNNGYGAALQSGFRTATKDLIFYTDGDAQYDVKEIPKLLAKMTANIDIVNGYKIKRSDPFHRIIIGYIYQEVMRFAFWLPIKDPDCDFRIMRRKIFDKVTLTSKTGTICIEMVKKFQQAGFRFAEVGVSHFFRIYGKSQFFNFPRVARTLIQLVSLWFELMVVTRNPHRK